MCSDVCCDHKSYELSLVARILLPCNCMTWYYCVYEDYVFAAACASRMRYLVDIVTCLMLSMSLNVANVSYVCFTVACSVFSHLC